jgi:hypothetical protein
MKNKAFNILRKAGTLLLVFLLVSACERSWLSEDWNVNPNSPNDVPMELLVPTIEVEMGFNLEGNNTVRTTNLWMQQFDGYSRQSFTEMRYQLTPADVNNVWNSMYSGGLMTAKVLIDKAEASESPHYSGVAKVLTAVMLEVFTDLFGDLPYSDALNGQEGNLQPTFDSQQTIYTTIQSLLDQAIQELGSADNAIALKGDAIYNNNLNRWIAAAYAVKARAALQLSKVNGNQAYTDARTYAASAITSNAGDMDVVWDAQDKNPLYQFMVDRGDIRMCETFLNLFAADDPRIPRFFGEDPSGGISGGAPAGENDAVSPPGPALASQTSPTTMISYAEVKFIEAEANFMLGDKAAALAAYQAAVAASVNKIAGGDNTDWLDANINNETEGALTLDKIMTQKYLALHGQVQVFNDWRRTGIPSLSLVPGAKTTEIPRRFPYAQDEITYNSNTPSGITITQRLWWDQ